jgi:hypothetical protein
VGFWERQIKLRNAMLEGEREVAARAPAPALPVRDWFAVAAEQAGRDEAARLERDRAASAAHQARLQKNAQAVQDMQRAHGEQRAVLRDAVVVAQQAVASCEARINGADFDDAVRAAAELVVYQRRLEGAQQSFAIHMSHMP